MSSPIWKFNKAIFSILTLITTTFFVFIVYGGMNSYYCSYELNLLHENVRTELICRGGKVKAIHRSQSSDSAWAVQAHQFLIGNQVIFFVNSRQKLSVNKEVTPLDEYNFIVEDLELLFYYVVRDGGNLYIIERFPEHKGYLGEIEGVMGIVEPRI